MNESTAPASALASAQLAADREHELQALLLHIAVSCPANAAELSARISRPQAAIHEDLTQLMRDDIVHVHQGLLRTSAAARVIASADPASVREIHDQVLAELRAGDAPNTATLVALAESGCSDEALLKLLTRAIGATPSDAAALSAFTTVSRARNEGADMQKIRRATDAAAWAHPDAVLSLTEALVGEAPTEIQRSAALLAAGAHVQSNRCERALALYQSIGVERIGVESTWAVVASVGVGDLARAKKWREAMPTDNLTSYAAGLVDLADGLLKSFDGSGDHALNLLARSTASLTPIAADLAFPESPAALAALVAFGQGDPVTAEMILTRAVRNGLGGANGTFRHTLLLAWGHMSQGRLDAAERQLNTVHHPHQLGDRDLLTYRCVQGGIARRRSDLTAMHEAWREIRGLMFGLHLALTDLPVLGEMMVLASRVRDAGRITQLVQQATELLERLGHPPIWATHFYWQGVQAAFQSEDPAALLPYAQALARVGAHSPYAAVLAEAGETWLEVLRGDTDSASVELSVRALAAHGHAWDASRLAGQAALQHPSRESALTLMQLAREVMKEQSTRRPATKASVLTAREVEVATLVLEGHGYRAVGEQLFISPKTVEHHVARIKNRLGATSRAELLEKLHDVLAAGQASTFRSPPGP